MTRNLKALNILKLTAGLGKIVMNESTPRQCPSCPTSSCRGAEGSVREKSPIWLLGGPHCPRALSLRSSCTAWWGRNHVWCAAFTTCPCFLASLCKTSTWFPFQASLKRLFQGSPLLPSYCLSVVSAEVMPWVSFLCSIPQR